MRASTYTAVALASLVASSSAWADTKSHDKAKAKQLYEEGLRHYNVAEYAEAIRVWKEAYLVVKKPLLLFNIGQAYRLSGDCSQAMTFYDSYRREGATADNERDLAEAEALCNAKLAEKPAEPPPPVAQPAPVPIVVQSPPARDTAPVRSSSRMRTVGLVVGVAGVVSGGFAVYFARDAAHTTDQLNGYVGEWDAMHAELEADGQRSKNLAWGFGIGGIAALGAGVTLFVLGGSSSSAGGVAVVPTRGGAQVGWSHAF